MTSMLQKNLASDYRYECTVRGVAPVPIVFTFSVIGGQRTLDFMRWLGIEIPQWIENEVHPLREPLASLT